VRFFVAIPCLLLCLRSAGAQSLAALPNAPLPEQPVARFSYAAVLDDRFDFAGIDSEGDRGAFLDHFFKSGKLDGNGLAFTTETVQGVSFEFRGTVERGDGKSRGDDAYYVLKGTLVENTIDEAKKSSSRSLDVVLKSFPQDLAPAQTEKK